MVYDGSAKSESEGRPLNEFLETGPISADIEKAFLVVGIDSNDRDMLRSLWPAEHPERLNSKIKHLRFCRLVFGLRPSPAILGAIIYQHLNSYQDQYPELIERIKKSLYVDNLLSGGSSDSIRLKSTNG